MRRFWKDNNLTLIFLGLFVATLFGQAAAGYFAFNEQQLAHGETTYSFVRYLYSSDFAEQTTENWQSEFLQFAAFVLASVWLRQQGSTESKQPGDNALASDEEEQVGAASQPKSPRLARGESWGKHLYANSLLLAMTVLFLASWAAQSLAGWSTYNAEQAEHHQSAVSWTGYTQTPDFWSKTLQNWQSEFLAVAALGIFTVFLRQRGSAQSKPVGAPHDQPS